MINFVWRKLRDCFLKLFPFVMLVVWGSHWECGEPDLSMKVIKEHQWQGWHLSVKILFFLLANNPLHVLWILTMKLMLIKRIKCNLFRCKILPLKTETWKIMSSPVSKFPLLWRKKTGTFGGKLTHKLGNWQGVPHII